MPKKIVGAMVVLLLLLTLGLLGCGTGDKGPITGENPFGGGTGGGIGGGGGATGACEITYTGFTGCYNGISQSICTQVGSSFPGASSSFHSGTTCQNLGFTTCAASGPYEVCI